MLETILCKNACDWSDDEWVVIKTAIKMKKLAILKTGEITITQSSQFTNPTKIDELPVWDNNQEIRLYQTNYTRV